jgi:AraC-like DNA-binding protein
MQRDKRRRVDWLVATGDDPACARLASSGTEPSRLAQLTSELLGNPSRDTVDRVLREAVEFARDGIGLERAAIFLVGPDSQSMIGTWGTSARRQTTDEHDLVFAIDDLVRQFFARSAQGYPWSTYEDCPMVTHENGQSRVLGRGWLACTPIQGSGQPIGVLFNDTAITHAPLDEAKQARAAVLCSLLGRALAACPASLFDSPTPQAAPRHPLVRRVTELLAENPCWSFQEVARQLHMSPGHLTRSFKRHAGSSIVEYRNELRLARFLSQATRQGLLEAALGAGFGSYAQFHRVFRARFGKSPRQYLGEHQYENRLPGK